MKSLEFCPINQVYDANNKSHKKHFTIEGYITPRTATKNQLLDRYYQVGQNQKRKKDHQKKTTLSLKPQKQKKFSEYIPKKQKKSNQKNKEKKNKPLDKYSVKFSFGKQNKQSSYIPKVTQYTKSLGPGTYQMQKVYLYLQLKNKKNKKDIPEIKFRSKSLFTEQIQLKALQIPPVGIYNIRYSSIDPKVHLTKFQTLKTKEEVENQNQNQKRKIKIITPSPFNYKPTPSSYSIFENFKTKQIHPTFQEFQTDNKQKMKQYKLRDVKEPVGPGKYLKLEDWSQKFNDRKGDNYLSKSKSQSVYH